MRQWSTEEDQDTYNTSTTEERGRRIVARLDDLKEEILLQIAGEDLEMSAAENPTVKEDSAEACAEFRADSGAGDYEAGLIQLELYGAEELSEYLDREVEKSRKHEEEDSG